jgi:hypothetical protein
MELCAVNSTRFSDKRPPGHGEIVIFFRVGIAHTAQRGNPKSRNKFPNESKAFHGNPYISV